MFVFKSWTATVSRTFTVKGGLSRKEIIQLKVSLLKVFIGTLSILLSMAGHRVSVEVLRAVQILIAPLTGLLLMEMMVIGLLKMLTQQSTIQKLMSFR